MGKPLEVWGQPQGQISICSWVQPSQWVTESVHCGKQHPENPAFLWSLSVVILAFGNGQGPGSAAGAKRGSGLRDGCPLRGLEPSFAVLQAPGGVIRRLLYSVPAAGRAFIPWEEDEEVAGGAAHAPCSPQGCPPPAHLPVTPQHPALPRVPGLLPPHGGRGSPANPSDPAALGVLLLPVLHEDPWEKRGQHVTASLQPPPHSPLREHSKGTERGNATSSTPNQGRCFRRQTKERWQGAAKEQGEHAELALADFHSSRRQRGHKMAPSPSLGTWYLVSSGSQVSLGSSGTSAAL